VVAQSPQLPDAFTAEELILLGRTPYLGFLASEGPKDLAAARRAMEITDTLHFAQRRLAQLSGGERQRVVIARALAQEPDVLLLDEPTANLDLRHQTDLLQLTRDLAHRDGLTVVITLHDLNQAAQCADRLALLSEGRLLGVGEPASVLVPSLLSEAYRVPVTVTSHPIYKTPMVVPLIGHA
jgi:iron complex transport system ATP-binding protein